MSLSGPSFNHKGGDKLRIPSLGGKYLDVYWLHKHVQQAGGYDAVNATKGWPKIAAKLGYTGARLVASVKASYEKLLLPFDLVVNNTSPVKVSHRSCLTHAKE